MIHGETIMTSKKIDEPPRATTNSAETSFSDEILKLAQCLMPVAPTKKVKDVIDRAEIEARLAEASLSEVAWKAYDSAVGLTKVVPFLVEDEMLKLGAVFSKVANWGVHVVSDGLLITGQNPHSSGPAAEALMAAVKQKTKPAAKAS